MAEIKNSDIRFNKLRTKLPHRYTAPLAKKLANLSQTQVKLVFEGRIKDPETVDRVYQAALKLARLYSKTNKLMPRKRKSVTSKN